MLILIIIILFCRRDPNWTNLAIDLMMANAIASMYSIVVSFNPPYQSIYLYIYLYYYLSIYLSVSAIIIIIIRGRLWAGTMEIAESGPPTGSLYRFTSVDGKIQGIYIYLLFYLYCYIYISSLLTLL